MKKILDLFRRGHKSDDDASSESPSRDAATSHDTPRDAQNVDVLTSSRHSQGNASSMSSRHLDDRSDASRRPSSDEARRPKAADAARDGRPTESKAPAHLNPRDGSRRPQERRNAPSGQERGPQRQERNSSSNGQRQGRGGPHQEPRGDGPRSSRDGSRQPAPGPRDASADRPRRSESRQPVRSQAAPGSKPAPRKNELLERVVPREKADASPLAEPQELPQAFAELGLSEPLLRALALIGYDKPTPIQASAIPFAVTGRDMLGCAQTGTGKTAAFALPILQRLHAHPASGTASPRALILAPTRELALQIDESFRDYGRFLRLGHIVIFGGVGQRPQEDALRRRPAILTATPGRLLDLMNQGFVDLRGVEVFVLDEADRMLDMGFINDVKKVIARLPRERQSLLFSATMPPDIQELADRLLNDPAKVTVTPVASTGESIEQHICFVAKADKLKLLVHLLDNDPSMDRVIVFTRTKHGANRVAETLTESGSRAEAIHGNKSQSARQRALDNFKRGITRVLVASDLASRGIDVDKVSHVVNFELPNVPETYVHRIGRTGRAEESGIAIAFCEHEEYSYLCDIERLTKRKLSVMADHPWHEADLAAGKGARPPAPQGGRRSGGGGGRGRGGEARRHDAPRGGERRPSGSFSKDSRSRR